MKSIKEIFLFETDEEDELAALIAAQDDEMKAGRVFKDTEKSKASAAFEPKAKDPSKLPSAQTKTGDAAPPEPKKKEPEKQDWFQRVKDAPDTFRIDVDMSQIPPEDHEVVKSMEDEINKYAKYKMYGDMAKIINRVREEDPDAHNAIMQAVIKSPIGKQGTLLATLKGKKHGGAGKKGNPYGRGGKKAMDARLDAAFGLDKKD